MATSKRQPAVKWEGSDQPVQHRASLNFRRACDYRVIHMIKHPGLSEFHSRSEYLHAGLAEGDPSVIAYVPQPFQLRVGQRRYKPDLYVRHLDRQIVVEIKPEKQVDSVPIEALTRFFRSRGMDFEVRTNEQIETRQIEAYNWLRIVGLLNAAEATNTSSEDQYLSETGPTIEKPGIPLHELIDISRDDKQWRQFIAVLRALHRGLLSADLSDQSLDWSTRIYHEPANLA